MDLEKAERNALYKTIVEAGLNPIEFEFSPGLLYYQITHKPTESTFGIEPTRRDTFKILTRIEPDGYHEHRGQSWGALLELARAWCEDLKEPDLWHDIEAAREIFDSASTEGADNAPLTPEERTEISAQLAAIKESIRNTYTLSSDTLSRIEARLDEAEQASRRMGRKDWLLLFSGTVLTLIVTDIVTPDVAQHIFTMALQSLGHLFVRGRNPPRSLSSN